MAAAIDLGDGAASQKAEPVNPEVLKEFERIADSIRQEVHVVLEQNKIERTR
jgi:hypothetical protein